MNLKGVSKGDVIGVLFAVFARRSTFSTSTLLMSARVNGSMDATEARLIRACDSSREIALSNLLKVSGISSLDTRKGVEPSEFACDGLLDDDDDDDEECGIGCKC
jgi:hypothetical protein